ncbi:MAG: response regulator [Bacteroidota bacterium]
MDLVKVLIVEDKVVFAESLKADLIALGYHVVGVFRTGSEALVAVKKVAPDLIFMDINLAGQLDGIETTEMINKLFDIPVIYLTAFTDLDTLKKVQKTDHAYYLPKPYDSNRVRVAIDYTFAGIAKRTSGYEEWYEKKEILFLRKKNTYVKVNIADILWIKGAGSFIEIHTKQKEKFVLSLNLKQFSEKCNQPNLFRVNKSYLVNLNEIDEIKGNQIFIAKNSILVSNNFVGNIADLLPIIKR